MEFRPATATVTLLSVASLLVLNRTSLAQITPDQAVQAVRAFIGDGSATLGSGKYSEDEGAFGFSGPYYGVQVKTGSWAGTYEVRNSDGAVFFMVRDLEPSDGTPMITLAQAKSIGTVFLQQRYSPFNTGTWQMLPDRYLTCGRGPYTLVWNRTVGASGALSPYQIQMRVDGASGEVLDFSAPQDLYTGPTTPQISLQQATQIANQYAPYDPSIVPFVETRLEIVMYDDGIQWLKWHFSQYPDPEDPQAGYFVFVDAIDGSVVSDGLSSSLGGSGPVRGRRSSRARSPQSPRPISFRLGSWHGKVVAGWLKVLDGLVWTRVESLRALGARVGVDKGGAQIEAGARSLSARDIGGRFQLYGWWVPVRKTAEALGWTVDWLPKTREVVVHSGAAPERTPAPPGR